MVKLGKLVTINGRATKEGDYKKVCKIEGNTTREVAYRELANCTRPARNIAI
jgi:hypothetical protein